MGKATRDGNERENREEGMRGTKSQDEGEGALCVVNQQHLHLQILKAVVQHPELIWTPPKALLPLQGLWGKEVAQLSCKARPGRAFYLWHPQR